MKKYLALVVAFFFSCTSEIESPDSILQKYPELMETYSSSYKSNSSGTSSSGKAKSSSSVSSSGKASSSSKVSASSKSSSSSEDDEDEDSSSSKTSSASGTSSAGKTSSASGTSSASKTSSASGASSPSGTSSASNTPTPVPSDCPISETGPVSVYGALKACVVGGKGRICGSGSYANTPVQVRGVSLFWSNTDWGGEKFFKEDAVNAMVDGWKAEIIRVPMGASIPGTEQYSGSYATDKPGNMARVERAINAAIDRGVYVIIDWHSHNAHVDVATSTEFFRTMATKYGCYPNVIFEIYNEPKCSDGKDSYWCDNDNKPWTSWSQIKTYANTIIPVIRNNGGANRLILVGTPYFSQAVSEADGNYLTDNNVGYVFHFYADTHKRDGAAPPSWRSTYEAGITKVLNAGKPVFVTEYGTTDADGGNYEEDHYYSHNASSSDAWHSFMDANKISSCAWNLGDKYEGSAFFGTGSDFDMSSWDSESAMTESGQYIFNKLNGYANNRGSAPWRY